MRVKEKSSFTRQVWTRETNKSESLLTRRNKLMTSKLGLGFDSQDKFVSYLKYCASGVRRGGGVNLV